VAINLGTAYLQLEPNTTGLVPGVKKAFGGVESVAAQSGDKSGKAYADAAGKGSGGIKGMATKLGLIGLGVAAAGAFVNEFTAGIAGASALQQSKGAVEAIFGSDTKAIEKASKGAAKSIGLSENAYNELASTLGAGLKNKGLDDFAGKTQNLIGLGGDLAAQFGGSTQEAVEALSSMMRGESDPIERYGVSINETAVNAELAAKGQDKLKGAALDQAKAQARLDILFRQTADAQGAFGRESETLAGKQATATAQWETFRDNLGTRLLPVLTTVMGFFSDKLIPGLDAMTEAWDKGTGPLGIVKDLITNVADAASGVASILFKGDFTGGILGLEEDDPAIGVLFTLHDTLTTVGEYVKGVFTNAFDAASGVVEDVAMPIFNDLGTLFREDVLPVIDTVAKFVAEELAPTWADFANNVLIPAFQGIAAIVKWAWDTVIYPYMQAWGDILKNVVGPALSWLWEKVVQPTFKNIGDAVSNFGSHWATIWSGIQQAAAKPVNFVIGTIWNDGLRKVINAVTGLFGGKAMGAIPLVSWGSTSRGSTGGKTLNSAFANGGYTGDGGKWDPAGIVHAGEYVFTQEEVNRAGGPRAIEARKHDWLAGYAVGGYVNPDASARSLTSYKGKTFSNLFAGFLRAAERMAGVGFNISQGGFRPRTSYSGTSHQGDAVDILSPITSNVIRALRASGIAAWDRTGKGNWAPHIHGVPLPGRGYAAGSAVWQAQDYLRGGDGLGGRDNGPRVAADGSGWLDIPKMIGDVVKNLGQLSGPWGDMLKDSFGGLIGRVKDWALDKLGLPGFASGTRWAPPGLAWVGERGPELMRFRGGEQVYSAEQSAAMVGGHTHHHTWHVDSIRDVAHFMQLMSDIERRAVMA